VKASRRELSKVIRAIDSEIRDVFAAAYADVSDNFTKLFGTLFPGGTGRLRGHGSPLSIRLDRRSHTPDI